MTDALKEPSAAGRALPQEKHDACHEFFMGSVPALAIAYPARDTEGRPLGESHAPEDRRAGVTFDFRTSRYPGSRSGKPMNVSALEQITHHWDGMLRDVAFLRGEYLRRNGGGPMTVWHLWEFANVATSLPSYLMRRAERPLPDREVPARIAAMFKAMQGVFLTTQHMAQSGWSLGEPIGVDEFLGYTESNGLFLAHPSGQACSGPPHLVHDFVAATIHGGAAEEGAAPPPEIRDDVDQFFAYGAHVVSLMLAQILFHLQLRLLEEAGRAQAPEGGPPGQESTGGESLSNLYILVHARELIPAVAALLSARLDEAGPPARRLLELADPARLRGDPRVDRIAELLAGAPVAEPPAADLREVALPVLLDYLLLERDALATFSRIQRRINEALGRSTALSLDGDDISRVTPTPRDRLAESRGVRIHSLVDRTVLTAGSSTLEIR